MQLADKGIVGTDANGESQTTMMDVNGNLKVVPVDPKAQQKPKPATEPTAPSRSE